MSIETVCENCGAEYDIRHDGCPGCTIEIKIRAKHPPYKKSTERGYLPFEMFGEQFAVTRNFAQLDTSLVWRVTHVKTGAALPGIASDTKAVARESAMSFLKDKGEMKFRAALEKLQAKINEGRP